MEQNSLDPYAPSSYDRDKRALSEKQYSFLFNELERLQKIGIFAARDVEAARDRYCVQDQGAAREKTFICLILLGLVALCGSAFLYLHDVWRILTPLVQTLIVSVPFIVCYVLAFTISLLGRQALAKALLFAGAGMFWFCAAFQLGHESNYTHLIHAGFCAWLVASYAAVFVGFCSKQTAILALGAFFLAGAETCCARYGAIRMILLLIPILLGAYWSVRRASKITAAIYVVLYLFWSFMFVRNLDATRVSDAEPFYMPIFFSAAAFLCDILRQKGYDLQYAKILSKIALAIVLLSLFPQYAFENTIRRLASNGTESARFFLPLLVPVAGLWIYKLVLERKDCVARGEEYNPLRAIFGSIFALECSCFWLPVVMSMYVDAERSIEAPPALLARVLLHAMLLSAVAIMVIGGTKRRNLGDFLLGTILFLAWILLKIFLETDENVKILGMLGMLGAALTLLTAGWGYHRFASKTNALQNDCTIAIKEPVDPLPTKTANILLTIVVFLQIAFAVYFAAIKLLA